MLLTEDPPATVKTGEARGKKKLQKMKVNSKLISSFSKMNVNSKLITTKLKLT